MPLRVILFSSIFISYLIIPIAVFLPMMDVSLPRLSVLSYSMVAAGDIKYWSDEDVRERLLWRVRCVGYSTCYPSIPLLYSFFYQPAPNPLPVLETIPMLGISPSHSTILLPTSSQPIFQFQQCTIFASAPLRQNYE